MSRDAAEQSPLQTWLKPGSLAEAPKPDAPKSAEEVISYAVGRPRITYRQEMERLGIEVDGKRHRQSLDWAMMWLRENRPFYAYCFSEISRRECYEIPTLAVTCRSGRVELLYNPDFMAIHSMRYNVGFVQHELGHVIHGHLSDGQRRPEIYRDRLVNVAMDLAVDSLIQSPGDQPDWVLLPSKLRIPEEGIPPERWRNFPERATWEKYYDLLQQIRDQYPDYYQTSVVQALRRIPKRDPGDNQSPGADGEKRDGENAGGGENVDDVNSFDDHGVWAEDCDQPDVVDEAVRNMVRQAWQTMETKNPGSNGRGTIPGGIMTLIQELLGRASVPFKRLFQAFMASRFDIRRRPAVNRLSRRRSTPPGSRNSRRLRVLWCRDTSGSVSDEELLVSFNELFEMKKQTGVSVAVQDFDFGLQGPMLELDNVNPRRAGAFHGRGGTDFSKPLELAARERPDVCVITTDGYAPFPDPPPGVPVMWLITHNGASPPWGAVVRLPSRADIQSGHKATLERWRDRA